MQTFELKIDGETVQGRLVSFIWKKLAMFKEPERKGTAKGDPIGFSHNKYRCALYSLTNLSQKEISQLSGVSYGVLRKWNWEESFKEKVVEFEAEFTEMMFGLYEKKESILQHTADSKHYSGGVRARLLARFEMKIIEKDEADLYYIDHYLRLTEEPEKRKMGSDLRQKVRAADRMIFDKLLRMGPDLVRRKNLDQKATDHLEESLSLIKKLYERQSKGVVKKV